MVYVSFYPSIYFHQCSFFPLLFFLFLLSSFCFLYNVSVCNRSVEQKNGIVFVTSYIPRIAVTLFLLFLFVITNNKIKCCSGNEYILSIQSYEIRYTFDSP